MEPFIRHMLICEDVRRRGSDPLKIDVFGMMNAVRAREFPFSLTLCVYVVLTSGRGAGDGLVRVLDAEDDRVVYLGEPHRIKFGPDPTAVGGVAIHVAACTIPRPGLYWVEFVYNGKRLERQPLLVREH